MIIDPAIFLTTSLDNLYRINNLPRAYSTPNIPAVEPETKIILDTMIGFVAALFFLLFDLLRERPDDLIIWRRVQASMLLVDVSAMCAFAGALSIQGSQTLLWMKMCAVGIAAIARIAFLMNIKLKEKEA